MTRSLQQHINDDYDELDNANTSAQRKRHLENEVSSLEQYQANHPDEDYDPTPLELYCDSHPDASECKIYDD
jgi:hypothetical protein